MDEPSALRLRKHNEVVGIKSISPPARKRFITLLFEVEVLDIPT